MAEINREQIEQLVKRPSESLVVEIKTWISPTDATGQAKIVKGAIALRNRGGGYLVIGLDDKTLQQDRESAPADVREDFHVDVIQALVTKYASETFEIAVEFVEHEGMLHPVIVVPPGVKTPVCAKMQLTGDGGKVLVERDAVYVRTLKSNNTPSTAKAQWKDWSDVVETCFDNREADVGRFLRRHLSGANPDALQQFALAIGSDGTAQRSIAVHLKKVMELGFSRFKSVVEERKVTVQPHGAWEVALIVDGQFPPQTDLEAFANLLAASNPSYTGWTVWASTRNFQNPAKRPYVFDGAWETLIVPLERFDSNRVEFIRQQRDGRFYSYSTLYDDYSTGDRAPAPMTSLDPIVAVINVAEAIAVGHAFAKALQPDEPTKLEFMFRWSGLRGRVLNSWVFPGRSINPRASQQGIVTSAVAVPIDTAPSAFAEFVKIAIKPLFEVFEGFAFPGVVVDDLTDRMLNRKL